MNRSTIGFITLLLLTFYACEQICTDDLRMVGVTVMPPEGEEHVFLDSLMITEKRSGTQIDLCGTDYFSCTNGQFMGDAENGIPPIIFHDGLKSKIKRGTLEILVEGFKDSLTFQQEFTIGNDGCHVFKAAGPDTVYLRPMDIPE